MATIDIRRTSKLNKAEMRQQTEQLAKGMENKLGIRWQWKGDTLSFETPDGAAKGTTGNVTVDDGKVHLAIDLPLRLRIFKGTVEKRLKEELDKRL